MKNLLKTCFATLVAFSLFTACENHEATVEPELDLTVYENLSAILKDDFQNFGKTLRSQESKDVLLAGQRLFGVGTAEFTAFEMAVERNELANGRLNDAIQLTAFQKQEIESIISAIPGHSSLLEFNKYLDSKFDFYVTSDLSADDKSFMLTFVILYKGSLDFIANNQDFFIEITPNGRVLSWWDDWGKCAASIAGGAVTGATTLGLAGAAVGTVVLPVVGTVSAGAVGAVGGGIGGALTGAAAGC